MKNYYKILRVDREATADEIKKAYKNLVGEHHPAYNGGDRYATERFIDISVAYSTLINADKRKDYNRILDSVLPMYTKAEVKHVHKNIEPVKPFFLPKRAKNYRSAIIIGVLVVCCAFAGVYVLTHVSLHDNQVGINMPVHKNQTTENGNFIEDINDAKTERVEPVPEAGRDNVTRVQRVRKTVEDVDNVELLETSATISTLTPYEPAPGDTKNMVLQSYGTPKSIVRFATGGETWYYQGATLSFRNDVLVSYQNK